MAAPPYLREEQLVKDGIVSAAWARRAVAAIDGAIAAWNGDHPDSSTPLRVAWGYSDQDAEGEEERQPPRFRQQEGLLGYLGLDVEVLLSRSGDRSIPDRCDLTTDFPEGVALPLHDAVALYNLLACCEPGVALCLLPDPGGDRAIIACGVSTQLPAEGVTGRILGDVLDRLSRSHHLGWLRLSAGEGDDHWGYHGGA
jgi:hypothetical protein